MSSTNGDMSKINNKKTRELYGEPHKREEGMQNSFKIMKQKDKLKYINKKIQNVRRGTAREYIESLYILRQRMEERISRARILRMLKMKSIEQVYAAEKQAARQHFEAEKQDLFDSMKEELMETIEKWEKSYDVMNIRRNIVLNELKETICEERRKLAAMPQMTDIDPHIVYMLRDEEIVDDLTVIKGALKHTAEGESCENCS